MAILVLGAEIEVVRIPELPAAPVLANEDQFVLWDASTNITSKVPLTTLRTFIETGSGGTVDAILSGGSILYVASGGDGFEGTDSFVYPSIAGFSFKLTRDGYPLKIGVEYLILAAGGFKLIDGTTIIEGQRYELDVFELYNGMINPPSGVSNGGFIVGTVNVPTNINISANDMNKLHQVRGAGTALTITLPDVALCADNSFVPIESLINNTKQHRITTTSGQFIYINNEAVTELYLGVGEYAWFFRTTDGWYVIADKITFYNDPCIPKPAYKVGLNKIACIGQLLLRADYPRLWKEVQTLGGSLVSDATWSTVSAIVSGQVHEFPYRGAFSSGDGSTTFRLPDYRGQSVRGLINPGGSDTQRHFNTSGGYQRHGFETHFHSLPDNILINGSVGGGEDGSNNLANINPATGTGTEGGTETRMDNIGLNWVINF